MFRCLNRPALRLECTWEESLPLAKAAGFEGSDLEIESNGSASQYAEAFAKHGLRPGGAKLPFNYRDEITATREGLAEVEKTARTAAEAGCTRFTQFILPFSDDLPWRDNLRFHIDRLGPIAKALADHGCSIGLEFMGPRTLRDDPKYSLSW